MDGGVRRPLGHCRRCRGNPFRPITVNRCLLAKQGFEPRACRYEPADKEVEMITVTGEMVANETGPRILDGCTTRHQQVDWNQLLRLRRCTHDGLVHFMLVVMIVGEARMGGISGVCPRLMPDVLRPSSCCAIEVTMQSRERSNVAIEPARK